MTGRVESVRSGALFDQLGQAWRQFGRTVSSTTRTPIPHSCVRRACVSPPGTWRRALLSMELADPSYPEFGRWADTTCSWGIDNPDVIYTLAAVSGDRMYRIHATAELPTTSIFRSTLRTSVKHPTTASTPTSTVAPWRSEPTGRSSCSSDPSDLPDTPETG